MLPPTTQGSRTQQQGVLPKTSVAPRLRVTPEKRVVIAVNPLYPCIPHLWIQPIVDRKYLEKIPQKIPKSKTGIYHHGHCLHSVYVVLGVINNPEMT